MQNKMRLLLLFFIILVLATGLFAWWGSPRLLAVSPEDGTTNASAEESIQLFFSHRMIEDSVTGRLVIEPSVPGSFSWQGNALIFTPSHPWPSGVTVQARLKAGSRAFGWLSLAVRQDVAWSFAVSQPRLVYLYPADQPANIYVLDPLSGESKPVTDFPGGVLDFDLNIQGNALFLSANEPEGGSSIYRLDLDDLKRETVSQTRTTVTPPVAYTPILACPQSSCRSPVVSPQGDFMAFERTSYQESGRLSRTQVWIAPLSTSYASVSSVQEESLKVAGDLAHLTLMPAWSPDGLLAFYDIDAAAFIIFDPREGERARFPNQTGQPGAWSPDGRYFLTPEIYFLDESVSASLSGQKSLADSHLMLFDWQSGVIQDLTPGEGMEDVAPVYSPDGAFLAFARKYLDVRRWSPGRQIWLLDTQSGETKPLTDDPLFNHFDLAWSHNSGLLAYVRFDQSSMNQPPEIWMIDPFTGQATQLIKGGYAPRWLPP